MLRIPARQFLGFSCLLVLLSGALPLSANQPVIACGSPFLANLVMTLLGDEIPVLVVDFSESAPDSAANLASAQYLVYQRGQTRLLQEADKPNAKDLKKICVETTATFLIPGEYLKAAQELNLKLKEYFPEYTASMLERLQRLSELTSTAELETLAPLRNSQAIDTVCLAVKSQADFVQWLGFKVVDVIDPAQALTPEVLSRLAAKVKSSKAQLVIGNIDAGDAHAAKTIAAASQIQVAVLSNRPSLAAEEITPNWRRLLDENVQSLVQALPLASSVK